MHTTTAVVQTSVAVPVSSVTTSLASAAVAASTTPAPLSHFAPTLEVNGQGMAIRLIRSLLELLGINKDLLQFSQGKSDLSIRLQISSSGTSIP